MTRRREGERKAERGNGKGIGKWGSWGNSALVVGGIDAPGNDDGECLALIPHYCSPVGLDRPVLLVKSTGQHVIKNIVF